MSECGQDNQTQALNSQTFVRQYPNVPSKLDCAGHRPSALELPQAYSATPNGIGRGTNHPNCKPPRTSIILAGFAPHLSLARLQVRSDKAR